MGRGLYSSPRSTTGNQQISHYNIYTLSNRQVTSLCCGKEELEDCKENLPVSSVLYVKYQKAECHKNSHEGQNDHNDEQSRVDPLAVVYLDQLVSGVFTTCKTNNMLVVLQSD